MESEHLKLEILTPGRIPQIFAALGTDPEIYRWLPFPIPESEADLARVLNGFIADTNTGLRVAHAVILKSSNLAIGTTSFLDLNPTHNSVEIGSTFEGTLRHHMRRPDGTWRDSEYFSILRSEWPTIKANLITKLSLNQSEQ